MNCQLGSGKFIRASLFFMFLGTAQFGCLAATFRVDDSTSIPSEAATTMHWKSLAPTRTAGNLVDGATIVTVRLNLAPWLDRNGKIYLVLPALPIGQVNAEWATQGK